MQSENNLPSLNGFTRGEMLQNKLANNISLGMQKETLLSPIQKAAILIQYARDGQEIDITQLTSRSRLFYRLRKKYHAIFRLAAWSFLLIHVFERPLWTFTIHDEHWRDGNIYPSFQMKYMSYTASTVLIGLLVAVLWIAVGLEFSFKKSKQISYLTSTFCVVLAIKSITVFVDMITLFMGHDPVLSTSPVEALCVLLVEFKYENHLGYLIRTLPKFVAMMVVVAVIICTYTSLGFIIFEPTSLEATQYFMSYGAAVWNMLMVLNGSNWPVPMMPAFEDNRAYGIYFIVYIITMNWGMLNLVLGFVYLFFKLEQQQLHARLVNIKSTHYLAAFKLLDKEEKGFLTYSQVDSLLEELFVFYEETTLVPSAEERLELIVGLDSQKEEVVRMDDFLAIEERCFGDSLRILRVGKNKSARRHLAASSLSVVSHNTNNDTVNDSVLCNINTSSNSAALDHFDSSTASLKSDPTNHNTIFQRTLSLLALHIDSIVFDAVVDCVLFILGLLLVFDVRSNGVFYLYFILAWCEVIAKLTVKGRFRFIKSYRNSVDGALCLILLIMLIERNVQSPNSAYFGDFGIKIVILIRLFLFPRNVIATDRFKEFRSRHRQAFKLVTRGVDHFSFLLLVLFVLMYGYAALGQQIFGGMIVKTGANGDLIAATDYGQSRYWPLNFNDMPSGFVTMFVLLHVNNMHVTASGFTAIGGQWCELFFASFYAFGVLLMMNVLIAVFLDEFTGYMERLAVERLKMGEKKAQSSAVNLNSEKNVAVFNKSSVRPSQSVYSRFKSWLPSFSQHPTLSNTSTGMASPSGDEAIEQDGIELRESILSVGNIKNIESSVGDDDNYNGRHTLSTSKQPFFGTAMRGTFSSNSVLPSLQRDAGQEYLSQEEVMCRENISFCEYALPVLATSDVDVEQQTRQSIAKHEISIMHHLAAHHVPVRKTKKSLLTWMYGANQLSPHEKAAVLVQFARDGEQHSILGSEHALLCYRYRSKFSAMLRFASFLYAFLKVFERPVWTFQHSNWHDNSAYPMSGLPQLSASVVIALKLPLLFAMLFGLALELGYKEASLKAVFRNITPMRSCRYVLTAYCVVQILILFYCLSIDTDKSHLTTTTSHGSILYVLWFNRRSLSKFRIVSRIMPRLLTVLMVFLITVLIFGGLGSFIFQTEDADDDVNAQYFGSFSDSVWSVFVAITSSDYPNQVMPAYAKSREMFIYFFSLISIGAFCLLNIIIVVVLVEFQKAMELYTDHQKASRQILLMRAFEILDVDCKGFLEKQVVKLLLDELYLHYSDFQKAGIPQGSARNILIDILDIDGDGVINIDDFLYFLDVTRIRLSLDAKTTFMERYCPAVVKTQYFKWLTSVVKYYYFDFVVDSLVVLLIVTSLSINHRNEYTATEYSVSFTIAVLIIFIVEMVCKLLVKGYTTYFRSSRNRLDLCVTVLMILLFIVGYVHGTTHEQKVGTEDGFTICIRVLQMTRIMLFPRNLRFVMLSQEIKRFTSLMMRVFEKLYTLSIVFLCVGYVFASLGTLCFGGLINRSPYNNPYYEELMASAFGKNGFWALNFNDFMSSCITLFSCLHVSDFDVIATGFTSTTSDWSRLYFLAWYVIGVLLMLNIIKSFFLGEFLAVFADSKNLISIDEGRDDKDSTSDTSRDSGSAAELMNLEEIRHKKMSTTKNVSRNLHNSTNNKNSVLFDAVEMQIVNNPLRVLSVQTVSRRSEGMVHSDNNRNKYTLSTSNPFTVQQQDIEIPPIHINSVNITNHICSWGMDEKGCSSTQLSHEGSSEKHSGPPDYGSFSDVSPTSPSTKSDMSILNTSSGSQSSSSSSNIIPSEGGGGASVDPQVKRKKPAHRRASNFNVAVNLPPAAPVNIDANNKKRTSSSIDHTEKPMQYSVSIAHVKDMDPMRREVLKNRLSDLMLGLAPSNTPTEDK